MNKTNTVILGLFLFFAVLSFVSAVEVKKSEVVVVTDPYQNITAVVKDESGATLQTFSGRARKFGEYRFTYHGIVSKVKVTVSIINNLTDEVVATKDFGPYTMGNPFNVTLKASDSPGVSGNSNIPSTAPPVDSINGTNSTNATSSSQNPSVTNPLTGRVVGEIIPSLPKAYYFVIAGFLGIGLLIFVLRKKVTRKASAPKEPDHQKMFDKPVVSAPVKEEFKPETNTVVAPDKVSEAQEIQQKISELQKQLDQIRGEEKLIKLQRQLAREKEELRKLQEPRNRVEPQKTDSPSNTDFKI